VDEEVGQLKPMLWMPMLQLGLDAGGVGRTTVTPVAPAHWLFFTTVPPLWQDDFSLQVDPSPIP